METFHRQNFNRGFRLFDVIQDYWKALNFSSLLKCLHDDAALLSGSLIKVST